MVPFDKFVNYGQALDSKLISHQTNSHTLAPTIACGQNPYPPQFSALFGSYFIDFPGIFDTKGEEIGIAIDLAMKYIINKAKSTKVLLVIPANLFL